MGLRRLEDITNYHKNGSRSSKDGYQDSAFLGVSTRKVADIVIDRHFQLQKLFSVLKLAPSISSKRSVRSGQQGDISGDPGPLNNLRLQQGVRCPLSLPCSL